MCFADRKVLICSCLWPAFDVQIQLIFESSWHCSPLRLRCCLAMTAHFRDALRASSEGQVSQRRICSRSGSLRPRCILVSCWDCSRIPPEYEAISTSGPAGERCPPAGRNFAPEPGAPRPRHGLERGTTASKSALPNCAVSFLRISFSLDSTATSPSVLSTTSLSDLASAAAFSGQVPNPRT